MLPAATRRLEPPDRTRLLAACLRRFSPLALASVATLLASGTYQSILYLESLGDLTGSAFGRAILIKIGLILALIGLGALNLRRNRPALERLAAEGGPPGGAGRLLRRAIQAEVGLIVVVLGVTAALTSYPPPGAEAAGPFSTSSELGAARLELTVDPAARGANEIHLYLFDARDGSQYDRAKELTVQLRLPDSGIGPLEPRLDKAGPGALRGTPRADLAGRGLAPRRSRARVGLRGVPQPDRGAGRMSDRGRSLAFAASTGVWLLGLELLGVEAALAYLAPALLILLPLLGGRYPGDDALVRAAARRVPPPRRRPPATSPRRRPRGALLPRGGRLVGAALAGRAPPALART